MVNHGPDHVPPRFLMADNQIPWSAIKNQGDHGLPWSSFRLGTPRDFPAFRLRNFYSTSAFSKHRLSSTAFRSEIVQSRLLNWSLD
ncbi:hypothetical protein DPMN_025324 [Dreissena polymorpha]|uniref:Uncharacterized protein n=1 Tax=Dreissena polymorpha TaxID=45954 RepID=A0A9D4LPM3_DREPO|nr:hypothetical protein DPMN_025324 [Dreissena polymorpha]